MSASAGSRTCAARRFPFSMTASSAPATAPPTDIVRARGDRSGARHLVVTVAMRDLNDLGRDAEVVGHEAAIDRAVPLPARLHADRQQDLAGPGKGDGSALARLAPGDLEETR